MKAFLALVLLLVGTGASAATLPSFRFHFAYLRPGAAGRVDLQGAPGSEGAFIAACGKDGKRCACELLDANGKVIERTGASRISYDEWNNYFRCSFRGAEPARVRLVARAGAGPVLAVQKSLSISDLIGPTLDVNRVRYVYRYSCELNFLEKEGTTETEFDCSSQAASCDGTGNFCLLRTRLPFFLYADTYSTNFSAKPSDRLYGVSGRVCGLQIRQYNCAGDAGYPEAQFGLYAGQSGIWRTTLLLKPSPDQLEDNVGFAADPGDGGECPPGLEKRIVFGGHLDANDVSPSHNFPRQGFYVKEVRDPASPPPPLALDRLGQGSCDGVRCTMPLSFAGTAKTQALDPTLSNVVCVIPAETLPLRAL